MESTNSASVTVAKSAEACVSCRNFSKMSCGRVKRTLRGELISHDSGSCDNSHDWQTPISPEIVMARRWQETQQSDLVVFCTARMVSEIVAAVLTSCSAGTRGVVNGRHCVAVNSSEQGVFK
jgi:hypothetical protein